MNLWIWVLNCTLLFLHFYYVSQNEVKILVVDFPPPQSVPSYSPFLLLVLAQESVWQLSELIPVRTDPN